MGNGITKLLIDSVLSVIYCKSENCIICDSCCREEELICTSCFDKIEFFYDSSKLEKEGIELECYSAAYYHGIIPELIKKLKYKSDFSSGEVLAGYLVRLLNLKVVEYDLITYIPMTSSALKARGFNQSRYLAVQVGRVFNKNVKELLSKTKNSKDQIGLDEENRWRNLENCFQTKNKSKIQNKKILLVDDVITTGATAFCCAKELFKSGAEKVSVLTVAKSKL
jgi:competence protein ComFC